MKIRFEGASVYRPNPRLKRALQRLILLGAMWTVLALLLFPDRAEPGALLMMGGVAGLAALSAGVFAVKGKAALAAAREGLYDGERLFVRRSSIRAAIPGLLIDDAVLVLMTGFRPVVVGVESLDVAYRLERALQLDVEHRSMSVRFGARRSVWLLGVFVVFLVALLAGLMLLEVYPAFLAMGLVVLVMVGGNTILTVGDDGVGLSSLGRDRFVPYSQIENVEGAAGQRAPRILLRSRRRVQLGPSSELQARLKLRVDRVVIARAVEALERYRTRRAPVLPLSLSTKSRGSPADRVRALTSREHGGDAYRRGATDEDDLRRAVDEPTLPPRVRAEAALALGEAWNDDDLERIRRAAERSACRPLRDLFEAVADGAREAKLARALGRIH